MARNYGLFTFFCLSAIYCVWLNVLPVAATQGYGSISRTYSNYQQTVSKNVNRTSSENGCQCASYTCGCCAHLEIEKIGLNDTGCVNVTYLAKEYGVSFTLSLDNKIIYNETISVTNPPPYCIGIPYLKEFAELCVRFYDLKFKYSSVHGCVKLEARLKHVVVAEYNLGCFNLGSKIYTNQRLWNKYKVVLMN